MSKKRKPISAFKNEAEERAFWASHDSADYVDWSKAERVRFPSLREQQSAPAKGVHREHTRRQFGKDN